MRILFFIRVNEEGEIKRSDFNDIIRLLSRKGDETEVYDTATASHYLVKEEGPPQILSGKKLTAKIKALLFISRLLALYSFSRKNRGRYDVAHFCYIREEFLILAGPVLKIAARNIITVFGSDLGKRNLVKRIFKRFIYNCDIITVTASNGKDLLRKYFRYGELEDHIFQLPVPLLIMKEIARSDLSREEAKTRLGFSANDCIVVCGSVLSPNEQYEKWVPLLGSFLDGHSEIKFVFPFSYGDFSLLPEYKNLVEAHLPEGSYRIFTGWMEVEDTVALRKATDILVNLRKTDQFAGIIMESVYTNAAVITAGWLGYDYYTENEIWIYRAEDLDHFPEVFGRVISDLKLPHIQERLKGNSTKLARDFGYDRLIKGWDEFYGKMRL